MYYFTPGPTQQYPKLQEFFQDAQSDDIFSMSHRSERFEVMFEHMTSGLKKLMNIPDDFSVFIVGSATEAMERIVDNCIEEKSLHVVNGAFSKRFFDCAIEQKKNSTCIEISPKDTSLPNITPDPTVELLAITQYETSIGMGFTSQDIISMKSHFPDALLALDVVTSAPFVSVPWECVDLAFFSVQKGFGLPAGMGVLIVGPRALAKAQILQEKGVRIGTYHSFPNLLSYRQKSHTPETPNILGIYLLDRAIHDLLGNDPEQYNTQIELHKQTLSENAELLYSFLESHSTLFPLVVTTPEWRAKTVAAIKTPYGSDLLISHCKKAGFLIGSGYGAQKKEIARIANFPVHGTAHLEELLSVLEKFSL